MDKLFDLWNTVKKQIHFGEDRKVFMKPREIWFTTMGENIGFEENGKKRFLRPVLVLKKVGNLFFTVALTSQGKDSHRFYHKFDTAVFNEDNQQHKDRSYVILSQVKVMDKKRFTQHIGNISEKEFELVKEKLKALLL